MALSKRELGPCGSRGIVESSPSQGDSKVDAPFLDYVVVCDVPATRSRVWAMTLERQSPNERKKPHVMANNLPDGDGRGAPCGLSQEYFDHSQACRACNVRLGLIKRLQRSDS